MIPDTTIQGYPGYWTPLYRGTQDTGHHYTVVPRILDTTIQGYPGYWTPLYRGI